MYPDENELLTGARGITYMLLGISMCRRLPGKAGSLLAYRRLALPCHTFVCTYFNT